MINNTSSEERLLSRDKVSSLIIIANTFLWYLYAFNLLLGIVRTISLNYYEILTVLVINFLAAAVSALAGAKIIDNMGKRIPILLVWLIFGTISSFIPTLMDISIATNLFFVFFLFGASFGLGMPILMGYFADSTCVENRGSTGGAIFLTIGCGAFLLGTINVADVNTQFMILTLLRIGGLIAFLVLKPRENFPKTKSHSYTFILGQRSFLLYFIPWVMFCLVNQTSAPVLYQFFGEEFFTFLMAAELALSGIFAIVCGFFCDRIGRRSVAIVGFAMLGLGYAMLSIFSENMVSWYFYTVVDGVAWGIFYAVFFAAIWGDLARESPSDKYYAVGGLPYLLSNFLRFIVGRYIAETFAIYTVFSLASFFLFLAVLPLMFAPETLPEKHIRERELKTYIEKAKKIREKYA
ncbi:MAG: MFS transporter [Candidatus Bathyarchaeales archaeon]